MSRFGLLLVAGASLVSVLSFANPTMTHASALPVGIPQDARPAVVTGVPTGDLITVEIGDAGQLIALAGINAPTGASCYAGEASQRVADLLPAETVVYLQDSGVTGEHGELVQFVWVPGAAGKEAFLLNTKLVREGLADVDATQSLSHFADNLAHAETIAQGADAGIWGACDTTAAENSVAASSDAAYQGELDTVLTGFAESRGRFSDLMMESSVNPDRFFDATWRAQVNGEFAIWQQSYDQLVAITPPAELAALHGLYVETLRLYTEAGTAISGAIATTDMGQLSLGVTLMQQAVDMKSTATTAYDATF